MSSKIPLSYYLSNDVVGLAKDLLGKVLMTKIDGQLSGGMITETEAYAGVVDRASHAFGGRRTRRTETLYLKGGVSYVYLCYGIHNLFNIVTSTKDIPHAVLVRGIYPVEGLDIILSRRKQSRITSKVSDGPGKASKALRIEIGHNAMPLDGDTLWLEDRGIHVDEKDILTSERIGVDYAGEDAKLPYRFNLDFMKYL